jgi:shikimate kinase
MEHLSGKTDNRPLLNTHDCHSDRAKLVEESALREKITDLMTLRSAIYEKTAHIIIDTDGKSIEAVASEIISIIREELV